MGPDPILTDTPIAVPLGMIICLIALSVTAWPVLAGERTTVRRAKHAAWGSWACLAGAVLYPFAGTPSGLYGFLTLTAIGFLAAATLWRGRQREVS